MDIKTVIERLKSKNYTVRYFETADDAAEYIDSSIDNKTVGFGDSATMSKMRLYEKLSSHNVVHDPNQSSDDDEFMKIARKSLLTDIYLTSVNAMAETGEMVNIDGMGNRVAGSVFGHEKVYFVVSVNKLEPTLTEAVYRARNTAGSKNARRYKLNTPCAVKGDRCYDCKSPDRICNTMNIYLNKMEEMDIEVILINEDMGF